MKHTLKSARTLAAALITFGSLAGGVNGAVTLSNGAVTYDASNQLTRFQFTLTSDLALEQFQVLVFDADGGASWDDPNAILVSGTFPWNPIAVEGGEFYAGNLGSPIVFDGVNGIGFDYVFEGAQNVIGNKWQISAGVSGSDRINVLDNVNLAIGQAGSVVVPEPSSVLLFGLGALGLAVRRKRNA